MRCARDGFAVRPRIYSSSIPISASSVPAMRYDITDPESVVYLKAAARLKNTEPRIWAGLRCRIL